MIRAVLWILKMIFYTIYLIIPLTRVTILDKMNKLDAKRKLTKRTADKWSRSLVRWSGSKVTVIGNENIPKEGGILFVGNHQSNMDIPILMGFVEREKGFIAKLELKKMPVISTWMNHIGCLFMDRNDIRQSLKVINQGADMMKNGHALVIFPEGTRSSDGVVGEFKPGSLKLAVKAKVPIIPFTIRGSGNIMPKGKFEVRPTNVEVIISEPIKLDELEDMDSNNITELVRNKIIQKL
jgi:1-acyl-sn-glycerol-3-phosphate acyltransferase